MSPLRLDLALCIAAAVALAGRPASAEPEHGDGAESPPGEPDPREVARRHFRTGIKLYQDANYAGALAEFEAAYRIKPGAGSLQNVALCQKALFRYAEAAETLEALLARHSTELDEGETRAVREAIDELKSLVGSVLVKVNVPEARVTLNGRVLGAKERENAIRVNVGEHTLSADAPGYAPFRQTIRVASGQLNLPVEVKLRATAGFLSVTASDPNAYIGVDGYAKGRHRWRGPVEPGKEHLVQVYRDGFEPFEKTVSVDLGQTLEVFGPLGPALETDEPPPEVTPSGVPKPKPIQRGFYGLLSISALGMSETPLALGPGPTKGGNKALGGLGVRGGYRLSAPLAAELLLDFGGLEVTECDQALTRERGQTCDETPIHRDYALSSFHAGPNLRLMSTGARVRFIGTIGAGLVYHRLKVSARDDLREEVARGVDPYFMLDLGIGFNFGPWLAEAALLARIDGSSSLQGDFETANLEDNLGTTLPMLGISLRGGFGQWRPR